MNWFERFLIDATGALFVLWLTVALFSDVAKWWRGR